MDLRANLNDLTDPKDVERLKSIISELADSLDILYTDSAPNGNISARQGRIAQYKNGSAYETWQNVDGAKLWQRIDAGAALVTGDWIISTVNTARAGWTDVSATYASKFMRISITPLGTGGADTHSHTIAANNLPAHSHAAGTLAADNESAHTHSYSDYYVVSQNPGFTVAQGGAGAITNTSRTSGAGSAHGHAISGSTGNNTTTATAMTGDNVPAYIAVCVFQKD